MAEPARENTRPSRRDHDRPGTTLRPAGRCRPGFRSLAELSQVPRMAGVIPRAAFDNAARILDQIKSRNARLLLTQTGHDRLAHDLRFGYATLARRSFQMCAELVRDFAGERGHNTED